MKVLRWHFVDAGKMVTLCGRRVLDVKCRVTCVESMLVDCQRCRDIMYGRKYKRVWCCGKREVKRG